MFVASISAFQIDIPLKTILLVLAGYAASKMTVYPSYYLQKSITVLSIIKSDFVIGFVNVILESVLHLLKAT